MPFATLETGAATAQPVEVYSFFGTYNTYRLTSFIREVTVAGADYVPVPMRRNRLKVGTQAEKEAAIEVEMPYDHPMVQEYGYQSSPPRLEMELRRTHLSELASAALLWKGRVTAFSIEGRIAKLKVPSVFSYILQGNTPVPRFQAPCNHVLYDVRCGVDPAAFQHTTDVVSVVGTNLDLVTSPFGSDECRGGVVIAPSGEQRMVTGNVGTAFTITYPFSRLLPGTSVTVLPGCDHTIATCRLKFNNKDRFGGFSGVPDRNPFTSNIG